MSKNHILLALFFAVCWSFNAEAIMGMSASKALSYSNTVSGSSGGSSSGKTVSIKKAETKATTHMVTMSNMNTETTETKIQVIKPGDYINVILPSFSWSVDMDACIGTRTITNTRVSLMITGVENSESSCEIKFYGYDSQTEQMLNKILTVRIK